MFERFTEQARRVVVLAQDEARALGHDWIGTEHLLLGVLAAPDGLGGRILLDAGLDLQSVREDVIGRIGLASGGIDGRALATIGIDLDRVREAVEASFGPGALDRTRGCVPFTPRAKKALDLALRAAKEPKHDRIGSEHVLLGLAGADGVACELLAERGLTHETLRARVREALAAA